MVLESGEVVVTNSGNGANSTNTAAVTNASNNTLVQTNQAVVNNNLNLSANTGGNSASRNTGGDNTITTGDATIVANIMNFVNNNIAGSGRLFITVVNVFGSWRGNFFGPGQEKAATEVLTQGAEPAAPPAAGRGGLAAVESTANQEDTTEVVEVVEPVSSPRLAARLARLNFGSSIINSQLESNEAVPQAVAAGSQAVFGSASAKKVIHVNLAWLMLLAPVMAVSLYTWRRKVKI